MQLYNTLTRKVEQFEPQAPPEVTIYTCGPTVGDFQHIGNYATYIRWDILVRALQERDYVVNWVMNITDVGHLTSDADSGEDKLQKGAQREGKTAWEITKTYTKDFLTNLTALNVQKPTHIIKATDHIAEQIALIQTLETKDYTYIIDDGVYFDTSKVPDYGKLAGQDLSKLKEGARVEVNKQKRNPTDFALWKFSPKGVRRDMEWESPWGKGFPGWHIECSAMSMKYLGETLDIHTGGIEHIPIHHTNEIAQSEAATGKPFVRYWLHGNHIMLEGVKISKSLRNGITPVQLLEQGFNEMDIRLLILQSHYRTQANFTLEGLKAAKQRRLNLQSFADLRFQLKDGGLVDDNSFVTTKRIIKEELFEDLHTPEALAALSDLITSAQATLIAPDQKDSFMSLLEMLDRLFGLELLKSKDITDQQKQLIDDRDHERVHEEFAEADRIRKKLSQQGIELRDTPLGTIWSRTI